uniref:MTMR6-9 GRAM domain-containing protein n=1 Tax=Meleagris gallopavo TaxID=9103 RepID=A0A803XNX7_MELGA
MEFAELIKTPRADNAVLHRPFHPTVEGTLCLTGHHLIFSSRRQDNEEELWLLHSNIDCIEKRCGPSRLHSVILPLAVPGIIST